MTKIYGITTKGLIQTITPTDEFNRISILFFDRDATPASTYHFILSREDGTIITNQVFMSDDIQDNKYYDFNFDRVYVDKNEQLVIQLIAEADVVTPIGIGAAYEKRHSDHTVPFDFYPGGKLVGEGIDPHEDITIIVTNLKMRPIFSERVYFVLSVGALLLEAAVLFCFIGFDKKGECIDG